MADYAARREAMVDTQVRPSDVTRLPIIEALLSVPREAFVPARLREAAYIGENLPLAHDRVLLEPRSFAKMLEALDLGPGDMVLDLGAGLGYSAAVMARMADAVVALEEDGSMAREAEATFGEHDVDNVAVEVGALTEGAPRHGPYDAIMVEGAIEELPQAIADQLKEGGRIVALFMEGTLGVARIGWKVEGVLNWRFLFNASAPVLPGFARATEFEF
ncbi:protein-L-isoaspartate O-methyltransferase [Rhodovulum sulfidophilum]|uniref:protein-L-isoaspartate O-methyltransferase family protein n=1 Tax=Rhodovulum sulfidophilum TaxID=35806 RepID=UPI001921228B|nr:protein-L-isoaspartate O-methyltransferase [Rhodovulum sulfidophilum]MBL3563453.1 protein-L-isoaspartate O-methyltransferase [Rhodovulum sulfidophilum]MBL3583929.1 protein-L-isoaspartate O-methyltransferase [Rhodovulum sulfidophilum]MCE8421191.1 protein-L-isoaspartate O-methyltransferase [Rhodovulum sulfidophilum]